MAMIKIWRTRITATLALRVERDVYGNKVGYPEPIPLPPALPAELTRYVERETRPTVRPAGVS